VEAFASAIGPVFEWQEEDFGEEIDSLPWKELEHAYGRKGSGERDHKKMHEDFVSDSKRLEFLEVERDIEVIVSEVDPCERSLRVAIYVQRPEQDKQETERNFRLDYFNFPVVDNTRLADNHRLAVILEEFDIGKQPFIEISLVVFPSEYASLRDRPGMEEARRLLESAMSDEPAKAEKRPPARSKAEARGHAGKAWRPERK